MSTLFVEVIGCLPSIKAMARVELLPRLELIFGPMGSGKSSDLLRRLKRIGIAGYNTALIKSSVDTRNVGVVTLHTGTRIKAITTDTIEEVRKHLMVETAQAVAIDEGQFFPDLFEGVQGLLSDGKVVIVALLDGQYRQEPFQLMKGLDGMPTVDPHTRTLGQLIAISDSAVKLLAVCAFCGADAPFTMARSAMSSDTSVGGLDKYAHACRRCHRLPDETE